MCNSSSAASASYYQIFGIVSTASTDEIRKATSPSPTAHYEFPLLARVYETLSDATKRQLYDEFDANASLLTN